MTSTDVGPKQMHQHSIWRRGALKFQCMNLVLAIVEYSLGVHCISNVLRSGNRELHGINKTTDISGTERYSISQGSNLSGNSLIVHRETGRIEAQIVGNAESMVRVHMSGDLLECTRSLRIIPTENTRERKS